MGDGTGRSFLAGASGRAVGKRGECDSAGQVSGRLGKSSAGPENQVCLDMWRPTHNTPSCGEGSGRRAMLTLTTRPQENLTIG